MWGEQCGEKLGRTQTSNQVSWCLWLLLFDLSPKRFDILLDPNITNELHFHILASCFVISWLFGEFFWLTFSLVLIGSLPRLRYDRRLMFLWLKLNYSRYCNCDWVLACIRPARCQQSSVKESLLWHKQQKSSCLRKIILSATSPRFKPTSLCASLTHTSLMEKLSFLL